MITMRQGRRFEQVYIKYGVKSSLLFYTYLGVFVGIFFIAALKIRLEEHQAYTAEINGNKIEIPCSSALNLLDDRIYLYTDRNSKVLRLNVESTEYMDGVMYIVLSENRDDIKGNMTVEIISGKSTLLRKIFMKAGT